MRSIEERGELSHNGVRCRLLTVESDTPDEFQRLVDTAQVRGWRAYVEGHNPANGWMCAWLLKPVDATEPPDPGRDRLTSDPGVVT